MSPPIFLMQRGADRSGRALEVRWKPEPFPLDKSAAEYAIVVVTGLDEELATNRMPHSAARGGEKCRFSQDDFGPIGDGDVVPARVRLSVVGREDIEPQESEEFVIRFGEGEEKVGSGAGRTVRTFSDGLADAGSRKDVEEVLRRESVARYDHRKGKVVLRTTALSRSLEVIRPALVADVEQQWRTNPQIGRWRVSVRASGIRVGDPEFVPLSRSGGNETWDRAEKASGRLAERYGEVGGVAQVYDDQAADFPVVQKYVKAWTELLDAGDPVLALANTVEVQDLGGRTIGLVVLPAHPLRVAWHVAYDNLVFHTRFAEEQRPRDVVRELAALDGSLWPAFLPGPEPGTRPFVFADTLGFHVAGMAVDQDPEPKATAAILSRVLEPRESEDLSPAGGKRSAAILGAEILKYLDCHTPIELLHLHALRAGDGASVARALGTVREQVRRDSDQEAAGGRRAQQDVRFSLEFFPAVSSGRRSISARFLSQARGETTERRRSAARGGSMDAGRGVPSQRVEPSPASVGAARDGDT